MASDVLKSIIGKPTGTTVVAVERGQLALFAHAVKDDSPIYRDPRAAAAAGLPGIPAPPTYPFVMEGFGAYPELQTAEAPSGNPMAEILSAGVYELIFSVASYFATKNIPAFYDEITIRFHVDDSKRAEVQEAVDVCPMMAIRIEG